MNLKPRLTTWIFCVCTLALLAGCRERTTVAARNADNDDDESIERSSDRDSDQDVFVSPRVLVMAITVAPHRLEALKQSDDSHEYITCAVREGSRSWDDVGLRCRGNPGKEFGSGKPDLIVTFNKFVSGQRFHGQRRVILQSSRDDPSYLTAPVAFEMFRAANVPAPRCSFARVELNGKSLGLYVLTEGGADTEFLKHNFTRTDGNLYDEGDPPDVIGKLEKARGRDRKDQSDVDALAAAALLTDPTERWKQLQQKLDVNRFVNFTALEVLLWQDDCYALEARKFRLYHDPTTDRMVFFPKAVERILAKTDGPVMPECKGIIARAVLTTPEGQKAYREAMQQLLANVFNSAKVEERHRDLIATIRAAVAGNNADAAKAYDQAVSQFCDNISRRTTFVTQQMKPGAVD